MVFALDFDGTYDRAPALWDAFIRSAQEAGHRVVCVSCRRDTAENRAEVRIPGCETVLTGMASKLWHMKEVRRLPVDVWIDDDPAALVHGR